MRTHRGTVAVALLVGLGGLAGCDALPVGEEVHVTAIMEVRALNPDGTPPIPINMKFMAAKWENGVRIGTTFTFFSLTDLDGKVSFQVGYNLQKSSQQIVLEIVCIVDNTVHQNRDTIQYDEALAQSVGTGIAVITKRVLVQL